MRKIAWPETIGLIVFIINGIYWFRVAEERNVRIRMVWTLKGDNFNDEICSDYVGRILARKSVPPKEFLLVCEAQMDSGDKVRMEVFQ